MEARRAEKGITKGEQKGGKGGYEGQWNGGKGNYPYSNGYGGNGYGGNGYGGRNWNTQGKGQKGFNGWKGQQKGASKGMFNIDGHDHSGQGWPQQTGHNAR